MRDLLLSNIYIESQRLPVSSESGAASPEEQTDIIDGIEEITPLSEYLETEEQIIKEFVFSEKDMKYYEGLDIRKPRSRNSCCFTKR